ncbi:CRAL-TRIO domain-containing protein [Blastocladiella britannica]|nr:CRAL-TRIO domain-containing protein [Blastocladiella britannica]
MTSPRPHFFTTDDIAALRAEVALESSASSISSMNDVEVYKFLVAANNDRAAATKRIATSLAWRREFDLDAAIKGDYSDLKKLGKLYLLPQPSKDGRAVMVWRSRCHMPGTDAELDHLMRFFVDTVYGRWKRGEGSDRIYVIVTREGAESKHRDLAMARRLASTFNGNFPETLDKCIVYPTGWLVSGIWAFLKPFLDPLTVDKVVFTGEAEAKDTLQGLIDVDTLPTSMGGTWTGEPEGVDPEQVALAL